MGRYYTTQEALEVLKKHYITSSIQMVRKYIKEGKLKAEKGKTRKDGFRIEQQDLISFIELKNPGIIEKVGLFEEIEEGALKAFELMEGHEIKEPASVKLEDKNTMYLESSINQMNNHLAELIQISKAMLEKMETFIEQKEVKRTVNPTRNTAPDRHQMKSLAEFKKHIEGKVSKEEYANEELMKKAYSTYYDDQGILKSGVRTIDGDYVCPSTKEKNKRFVNLIKSTVPKIIKDQEKKPVQLMLFEPDNTQPKESFDEEIIYEK